MIVSYAHTNCGPKVIEKSDMVSLRRIYLLAHIQICQILMRLKGLKIDVLRHSPLCPMLYVSEFDQ